MKPLLIAGLVVLAVLYEKSSRNRFAPLRGQSAAQARPPVSSVSSGAAGITQALANVSKALSSIGAARSSGGSARPGIGAPILAPTQTGFNQPSNQTVNVSFSTLTAYGQDAAGNFYFIDKDGNVVNQSGNLVTDLSGLTTFQELGNAPSVITQQDNAPIQPPIFSQSAPGDGLSSVQNLFGVDSLPPVLDTGAAQDAALANDTVTMQTDFSSPDFASSLTGF